MSNYSIFEAIEAPTLREVNRPIDVYDIENKWGVLTARVIRGWGWTITTNGDWICGREEFDGEKRFGWDIETRPSEDGIQAIIEYLEISSPAEQRLVREALLERR